MSVASSLVIPSEKRGAVKISVKTEVNWPRKLLELRGMVSYQNQSARN